MLRVNGKSYYAEGGATEAYCSRKSEVLSQQDLAPLPKRRRLKLSSHLILYIPVHSTCRYFLYNNNL